MSIFSLHILPEKMQCSHLELLCFRKFVLRFYGTTMDEEEPEALDISFFPDDARRPSCVQEYELGGDWDVYGRCEGVYALRNRLALQFTLVKH